MDNLVSGACFSASLTTHNIVLFPSAYRMGDVDRVIVPSDSNGLRCGVDSEVLDKPYLVFFELSKCADPRVPLTGCNTPQVCVSNCPNETFIYGETHKCTPATLSQIRDKLICNIKVNKNRDLQDCRSIDRFVDDHRCARWYLRGESCKLICVPLFYVGVLLLFCVV